MNCFIHLELSKFKANNTGFRTDKPVNTAPDWTSHVTSSANHCQTANSRYQLKMLVLGHSEKERNILSLNFTLEHDLELSLIKNA